MYEELLKLALDDGQIDWKERDQLTKARAKYHISDSQHMSMEARIREENQVRRQTGRQAGRHIDIDLRLIDRMNDDAQ